MTDEWVAIASMTATAVGTAAVLGQASMQRRQGRLQAAAAHQQQAEAWAVLAPDWQLCVLAAIGDEAVWHQFVPPSHAHNYMAAVERYRQAKIGWDAVFSQDEIVTEDWDRVADEEKAALAALLPYRLAVQHVVAHLAQVSSLVLKRHTPVDAVYDAFGPQVLRVGDGLLNLLKMEYPHLSSCVAPVHQERALWTLLTAEQVNERLGWGNFLDIARGTAERISTLIDIVTAHALKIGDLDNGPNPQLPHPARTLAEPDRLATAWRGARSFGRFRAARVVWTLAATGRSVYRRSYRRYPSRLIHWHEQRHGDNIATLPYNGWILWPRDVLRLPGDVITAIVRARTVPDIRQVDSPRQVMDRLHHYEPEEPATSVHAV